jgi:diadenosine tetraphosphate (Ap4A) HIT family hydrolase
MNCPFCHPFIKPSEVILTSEFSIFLQMQQSVLVGSGLIIPKRHCETPFELTESEIVDAFALLKKVKARLDTEHHPDGYNIGWNSGKVAGQEVLHSHMHVIPRFRDEPLAGKGIRYWLKQDSNRRPANDA